MNKKLFYTFLILPFFSFAQTQTREVRHQDQAWFSVNSTVRLSKHWGFIADLHERRTNFLSDNSFHFARMGVNYWIKDNITATLGYGHMWVAPTKSNWHTFANEERLYQQLQMVTKVNKISLLQRIRNEQRWQQKIVNDKFTGDYKFTDRIRYLLSFTIPVSKNKHYPAIAVADEIAVQLGKEVIYNTFEQNRVFLGIKQQVTKDLSFDLGYMLLYQQKSTGYQYDLNRTFRWFFYYTPDWRKKSKHKTTA